MEGGLDSIGRVIDFSVLKTRFGEWIEKHWDHGFIIAHNDPLSVLWHGDGALGAHKHFFAPFNPTAENMARYLLDSIGPMVLQDLEAVLIKVVLEETENCSAEVTIDEDLRRREADAARARLVGSPTA
jgi:6-pyruvoyltetrahydropterin/6-carboxytetrahydropterin synthase